MASPDEVGPASRALDALTRVTDGFFRDPSTGDVVLFEKPNAQLKMVAALLGASRALRAANLVDEGDTFDVLVDRAAMAMLVWWSVEEVRHGTTKYLRTTGAVALVGAVMRTILVERGRVLARSQEASSPTGP